ncbi:MAG: hypothetical protein ACRD18_07730 [Terriglobia bacterium]
MKEKPKNKRVDGGPPHQVAVGVEEHHPRKGMLPVWFFVGLILTVYGVLIFITGILEFHHPPHTVLASDLHPTVWWGAIVGVLGGFFTYKFGPWKLRR